MYHRALHLNERSEDSLKNCEATKPHVRTPGNNVFYRKMHLHIKKVIGLVYWRLQLTFNLEK